MQPKKPQAVAASSGAAARAAAHTTERVHIMDDATSPPTGVDTLSVSEDLQKAGFSQPQANSLAHWFGKLVTKEDLRRVATHLNDKIEKFNKDLNDKIKELHKKIDGVSKEMRDKFDKMNAKIDDVSKELRDKIDDSNKELHAKIGDGNKELRDKIDKLNDKIDKNVYILLGGITALLGIMTVVQKLLP